MNLDKFLGCAYGLAIGDALGVPFETMTACEIRNILEGSVRKFESPVLNKHESSDFQNAPMGATSDDTLRFKAAMRGMLDAYSGLDILAVKFPIVMDCIAKRLVETVGKSERGWGRGTLLATKKLQAGVHWSKSGSQYSAGNGPIPGATAFGLWASMGLDSPRDFTEKCITYAKMTHLGTPAVVAAVVHAFTIASLAGNKYRPVHTRTLLYFLYKVAVDVEERVEMGLASRDKWKDKISDQVRNVMEYLEYGKDGKLPPEANTVEYIASLFFGGTSYAPSSFGFSYALFFKSCLNADNPKPFDAVFDAVNAGGDTDSNASIVGSLVGALHGREVIPEELICGVEKSEEILKLATRFYYVCDKLRQNKVVS